MIDAAGHYTHSKATDFKMEFLTGTSSVRWPEVFVHSGSVVQLKDGSYLTTMYGHGAGTYRKWTVMSALYFVVSANQGRTWTLRSTIPWQSAFGANADGPGEPTTARLADGTLWCIFRADSTEYYWSATSTDEGMTWVDLAPLNFSWSVKPRLRVTSKNVLGEVN
jgi:hypothetical protein